MERPERLSAGKLSHLLVALDQRDADALFDLDVQITQTTFNESCRVAWEQMSDVRRQYLAASHFTSEVDNGGVTQFMSNKGPAVIRDALAFFDAQRLDDAARWLRRAIDALPGGTLPHDFAELESLIVDAWDDIEPVHGDITDEILDSGIDDVIQRARLEHARRHSAEFFD